MKKQRVVSPVHAEGSVDHGHHYLEFQSGGHTRHIVGAWDHLQLLLELHWIICACAKVVNAEIIPTDRIEAYCSAAKTRARQDGKRGVRDAKLRVTSGKVHPRVDKRSEVYRPNDRDAIFHIGNQACIPAREDDGP